MNWWVKDPLGNTIMAASPHMQQLHPRQPEASTQGILRIMYELQGMLAEIGGVHEVSLQPSAGAHGEFLGMRLVRAHFDEIGEGRSQVLLPDTSHGTNPASAVMAGYEVLEVPSKDPTDYVPALKHVLSHLSTINKMLKSTGMFE